MQARGRLAAVFGFVLLTFGVTWAIWWAVAVAAPGSVAVAVGGPVFLLGVFAPGMVALAMTASGPGNQASSAAASAWSTHRLRSGTR